MADEGIWGRGGGALQCMRTAVRGANSMVGREGGGGARAQEWEDGCRHDLVRVTRLSGGGTESRTARTRTHACGSPGILEGARALCGEWTLTCIRAPA